MGVRKLAAWMGLVEDGRYRTDDPVDHDAEGEATNDVYVDEEPSQEISRVAPIRRPAQLTPVEHKEVADLSRMPPL